MKRYIIRRKVIDMSSSLQCHEIFYNFFKSEEYKIFLNRGSLYYITSIIIQNNNGKLIRIYNEMKDLGDWNEIGIILVDVLENIDQYDLNSNDIIKFNYLFEFGKLLKVKDVFIIVENKKYRTGFLLEFEKNKLLIVPSVFPCHIHAVGINGYIDFYKPEFPIDQYFIE